MSRPTDRTTLFSIHTLAVDLAFHCLDKSTQFSVVFKVIRKLMEPLEDHNKKRPIGFMPWPNEQEVDAESET